MQFLGWLEAQNIFDLPFHSIKLISVSEGNLRFHNFSLAYWLQFLHQIKWTIDRSFIRTTEVVVKNTVSSIHCLGNNDRFKQLLLENISSANTSDANGWSSSIKLQDIIVLFYQGCRPTYFNLYLEPTEALREGTDKKIWLYIQSSIFTFLQKSQVLSHKWLDALWVLNKVCKIDGVVSVLISNPNKRSNQVHFSCSTICLYGELFIT